MMSHMLRSLFALLLLSVPLAATASASEDRLALVIGNAAYKTGALATTANDAALIAQALRAQGFDVTGSRDLDAKGLRQAFDGFRNKVRAAGPDSVIVVYFAGLGLQVEGDNYLIPVGTVPAQTSDIRRDAVQLASLTRSLAELRPAAAFVFLDAARKNPFAIADGPLAEGLAFAEPEANFIVALSAAPGTIAFDGNAGFGPYATALAEMLGQDGLSAGDLFARVRLRVNEATNGGQVPWQNSRLENSFTFAERASDAPQRTDAPELTRSFRTRPMHALSVGDAYYTALMRDTFDGYAEFLAEYWQDPATSRVRALLAARREVLTWHRSTRTNTANAYWTYLERYPHGPHLADAQRWLTRAGAAVVPPANFSRMECDVPSPLPDERQYIERAGLNFGDPALAFGPLLPMPIYFLAASSPEAQRFIPARSSGDHDLPALTPAFPGKPVAAAVSGKPVPAKPVPAKPVASIAVPAPLPRETEQLHQAYAKTGDATNVTSAVPPSARPAAPDPTTAATVDPSAAATAVPWIVGAPSYQWTTPGAVKDRPTTQPPVPPSGEKAASVDVRPVPGPSNRLPAPKPRPLPSPQLGKLGPPAARTTTEVVNSGVPRAGVAAVNSPPAAANTATRAPDVVLRPGLELPARAGAPRPINGSPASVGSVAAAPVARPTPVRGKPPAPPARKPAPEALRETPAAPLPSD